MKSKNYINNSLHGISVRLFSPGSAYLIQNVLMVMSCAGRVGSSAASSGFNQRCKHRNYLLLESEGGRRIVAACSYVVGPTLLNALKAHVECPLCARSGHYLRSMHPS